MKYQAQVNKTDKTWQGVAIVPVVYLPPNITRMNACAIHGTEPNRVYESLYPVPTDSSAKPDLYLINLNDFISFIKIINILQFVVINSSSLSHSTAILSYRKVLQMSLIYHQCGQTRYKGKI